MCQSPPPVQSKRSHLLHRLLVRTLSLTTPPPTLHLSDPKSIFFKELDHVYASLNPSMISKIPVFKYKSFSSAYINYGTYMVSVPSQSLFFTYFMVISKRYWHKTKQNKVKQNKSNNHNTVHWFHRLYWVPTQVSGANRAQSGKSQVSFPIHVNINGKLHIYLYGPIFFLSQASFLPTPAFTTPSTSN